MSYEVIPTSRFKAETKRLLKKYPSLSDDLSTLNASLSEHPEQGTPIGYGAFKIRIAITSKGKGKQGGGRVITLLKTLRKRVYLLSIYDKSEISTVSDKTLRALIAEALGH
jgi:mRNA-degrading endonuclease RelE of RelBE toxin-antitoxin system